MKKLFTRSRRWKILFLAVCVACVYFTFQFLTIHVLHNHYNQEEEYRKKHKKDKLMIVDDIDWQAPEKKKYLKEENIVGADSQNIEPNTKSEKPSVLGVLTKNQKLYLPNNQQQFVCLKSKEPIPISYVNDDYCDCKDGSDEPGTNACPDNRFYCTFQMPSIPPQSVWSSQVNDGICDCCDGSDEWNNVVLDKDLKKDNKKHYGIYQAPCQNHCTELKQKLIAQQNEKAVGLRLKQIYLKSAKDHNVQNNERYGPQGVFYKLSEKCFPHNHAEYEYNVCPFRKVTQAKHHSSVTIGKNPRWLPTKDSHFKLEMRHGNACPGVGERKTIIDFSCGLEDVVKGVTEDEKCLYVVKFATPAAC